VPTHGEAACSSPKTTLPLTTNESACTGSHAAGEYLLRMTTLDRPKLVAQISSSLSQKGYPRLQMTFIVAATGLTGFLASVLLLHLGMVKMWQRYPLAVMFSYSMFLLLLKLWIVYQERSLTQDLLDAPDFDPTSFLPDGGPTSSVARSGGSHGWTDLLPDLDGDELAALIIFLLALVVAVVASVLIVCSAPALLGEVFLHSVVIAGLRKKMIGLAEQHWTLGAVRRTVIPFVAVALVFSLAGAAIQHIEPGARSIGGVLHAERVDRR
jgi:hypothetical protein